MADEATGRPTRVMVVDDHGIVRDGVTLRLDLVDEIDVVGEAEDGVAALKLAGELEPDVILMDVRMPRMDGIEATRRLHEFSPGTKIVILTTFDDRDFVRSAMDAGASGYLLKTATTTEIVSAIKSATEGKVALDPEAARALVETLGEPDPLLASGISSRELEVLTVLCEGKSNREIAEVLHISPLTVKTHLQSIFHKLGAADRAQAVAIALRTGLVK